MNKLLLAAALAGAALAGAARPLPRTAAAEHPAAHAASAARALPLASHLRISTTRAASSAFAAVSRPRPGPDLSAVFVGLAVWGVFFLAATLAWRRLFA